MTVMLYGIKNCDTVKKARKFLDQHQVEYEFHDYREEGVNPILLAAWAKELGWEALLNKRSTTWRQLPDETKDNINEVLAMMVMEDQPTLIKRPVLELPDRVLVGFNEATYTDIFN